MGQQMVINFRNINTFRSKKIKLHAIYLPLKLKILHKYISQIH